MSGKTPHNYLLSISSLSITLRAIIILAFRVFWRISNCFFSLFSDLYYFFPNILSVFTPIVNEMSFTVSSTDLPNYFIQTHKGDKWESVLPSIRDSSKYSHQIRSSPFSAHQKITPFRNLASRCMKCEFSWLYTIFYL